MEYTHKKPVGILRIAYILLIVLGFVLYPLGSGSTKLLCSVMSITFLVAGIYFLIKTEMNTITCVIKEKGTDFDFYVKRAMGRRESYLCYYYLSDAVKIVKHSKEAVKELYEKYNCTGYYSFCHGILSKEQYIILFQLNGNYDMIVIEMNEEFKKQLEGYISKAVPVRSDVNDDEDSE